MTENLSPIYKSVIPGTSLPPGGVEMWLAPEGERFCELVEAAIEAAKVHAKTLCNRIPTCCTKVEEPPSDTPGPKNHLVPGLPMHGFTMAVGGGAKDWAIGERNKRVGLAMNMDGPDVNDPNLKLETSEEMENEGGMPWALENLSKVFGEALAKLCDDPAKCCKKVEFILRVDAKGDSDGIQKGIDQFAPSRKGKIKVGWGLEDIYFRKDFKCGEPAKLP